MYPSSLHNYIVGDILFGKGINIVYQLYIARLLYTSGVFDGAASVDSIGHLDFAECVTWHLLRSILDSTSTWAVSNPRNKHLVGLAWYSSKLATALFLGHTAPCVTTPPLVGKLIFPGVVECSRESVRNSLAKHALEVVVTVLSYIHADARPLNGKDIQQLLMLCCEPVFQLTMENSGTNNIPSDFNRELEDARRAALRSIEHLAEQYAGVMDDSELLSVFVSCCTKDVRSSVIAFLAQSLRERMSTGRLNVSLRDFTALFNTSKTYNVPGDILTQVIDHLSRSRFNTGDETILNRDNEVYATDNPTNGIESMPTMNSSLVDFGRFCKSLYHLHCNKTLLGGIDRCLCSILESFKFNHRMPRGRNGPRGMNSGVVAICSTIHLLARNGYTESRSVDHILPLLPSIPWDDCIQDDMILLADLCWSLLTLHVDASRLAPCFDRLLRTLNDMPLKHCVKLLGGLYNSLGSTGITSEDVETNDNERVPMDDLLSYTLNESCETLDNTSLLSSIAMNSTDTDKRSQAAHVYTRSLRSLYMNRFKEVDDVQNISNFMFYITSILNDLNTDELTRLCDHWVYTSSIKGSPIKVEALSQVLWSLQKSRVLHEPLLTRVLHILKDKLWSCSIGQLALMSHTLLTFNVNTPDILVPLLSRVEHLVNNEQSNLARDVYTIKLVSVLWSVALSDITSLGHGDIQRVLHLLSRVDWQLFMRSCRHQDLRKVLQIVTSIEVELCHLRDNELFRGLLCAVPDYVKSAAIDVTRSVSTIAPVSASQDKARRCLLSYGTDFKCEFEIYHGITVDFAISRGEPSTGFNPDLVIEIDGPFHYNILCGTSSLPYIQCGNLRLIANGKTEFRNRILRKLGYAVEPISWMEAHIRPIHNILGVILRRHRYCTKRK
eukprot:XP_001610472.1 hypothetical protein [Babesia bovis T2Bo]